MLAWRGGHALGAAARGLRAQAVCECDITDDSHASRIGLDGCAHLHVVPKGEPSGTADLSCRPFVIWASWHCDLNTGLYVVIVAYV